MPSHNDPNENCQAASGKRYLLRLYVAGNAPNSTRAVSNLYAICDEHLAGRCDLEIVDILQDPRRALDDNVLVTPTLAKLSPPPEVRIIGNLSEKAQVLSALGIGEA